MLNDDAEVQTTATDNPAKAPLGMAGLRDALATAMDAGRLMMEAGAATTRVEETVHRFGTAMGAEWLEVFTTPTGIIAMASSAQEHRTRVLRIVRLGVDLARIDAIIALSRRLAVTPALPQAVQLQLDAVARTPRQYSPWLTNLAVGLGCAAFAYKMGGRQWDIAATFIIAALSQWLRTQLVHWRLSPLVITAVVATAAAAAGSAVSIFTPAESNIVISASVLLLVPGVYLVGSIYDLIAGNLLSGLARAAYAGSADHGHRRRHLACVVGADDMGAGTLSRSEQPPHGDTKRHKEKAGSRRLCALVPLCLVVAF